MIYSDFIKVEVLLQLITLIGTNFISIRATKCNNSYVPFQSSCDECGKTYYQPNVRIVGGIQAVAHSWPAQVLIIQNIKGDYKIGSWFSYTTYTVTKQTVCGGTLINRYTILSAAHCIETSFVAKIAGSYYLLPVKYDYYPTLESMFDIYVGADYIGSFSSLTKMKVKKAIKHENYNDTTYLNDVSLFILNEPVSLSQDVQIACLTNSSYMLNTFNNRSSYACGWGAFNETGSVSNNLYNVKLNIYNDSKCSNVSDFMINPASKICAGEYNGGKDTCQGDSGGGLYVFDVDSNKYILAGVTSYGIGCARPGYPGVYTRVSYYYDWILSNWYTGSTTTTTTTTTTTNFAKKLVLNLNLSFFFVLLFLLRFIF